MPDHKIEIHSYNGPKPFAFISYSHDDLDTISEYLNAADENYRFWYDEGIKSGAEWVEEIGNKIFDCDIFIVFLSKSALTSHYIKDEITYAYKYAKKMMAVLLEPVSLPRSLELMLGRFQYINFYEENTFDDRLLMFIQGIPDSVRRSETDTDFPADSSSDENSEYHPYTYATKMRILGAIDAEQLDLVLMDREAFDAFSQNGYLTDLQALLSEEALPEGMSSMHENTPHKNHSFAESSDDAETDTGTRPGISTLYDTVQAGFRKNIQIKEDNSVDVLLGNESEYSAVTTEAVYGVDLSSVSARIQNAELNGTVYLGIIENSPRKAEAVKYLNYLVQEP